jgi:general stress protein 26
MSREPACGYVAHMKTTTASRDPDLFHRLLELVRDIDIAMMTTVTPDGALHSRPMVTAEFTEDGEIWFFTSDESAVAHDLAEEQAINLSYADPRRNRYVSVTGNASLVRDKIRARELWDSRLKTFFPRGLDEPHLTLMQVRVETAELWDYANSKKGKLFGHATTRETADGAEDEGHAKIDIRNTPSSG